MKSISCSLTAALLGATLIVSTPFTGRAGNPEVRVDGATFATFGGQTEAYGKFMTVSITGLPAGTYAIEIEGAEYFAKGAGQRVMDIRCGDTVLAADLDLFKEMGAQGKTFTVKGTAEHKGDSLRGPLTITFSGKIENAKFDTIRIRDTAGKVVAECTAKALQAGDQTFGSTIPRVAGPEVWKDASLPPEVRAADLAKRMSLREKVSQIQMGAPAIPRLGIPAYDWWNESLHGVARAGIATVFPQAIAVAATWDTGLLFKETTVMSDEARAKHHDYARRHNGNSARYYGLDMWSPNINIFRDPRWGRGHETYGEDPYLTGRMGVAFVKGMQGDDPKYIKVFATPKHYAVHSGPEHLRHVFDAQTSDQDLWETYLPAFEACFREGKAGSIMTAYNRFRGESCTAHPLLMDKILRETWGFNGYSVSDVDSAADIYRTHHIVKDGAAAAALALKAGLDLNSGSTYNYLPEAIKRGLCTEADVDRALTRDMIARIRLGMFDPPEQVKYAQIPMSINDCPAHDALALEAARECMVLLKNDKNTLPLAKAGTIAVIGPNADNQSVLLGNYNGNPSHPSSVLAGIRAKLGNTDKVMYAKGCDHTTIKPEQRAEALAAAQKADTVILVMGITGHLEGEEGEAGGGYGFDRGDRTILALPKPQEDLMKEIVALKKPTVLVLMSGSSVAINWAKDNVPAILQAWYPGQRGGDAVADVLFGDYNPAGRLPVTFYKSEKDLPSFTDYNMKGRTYRYFAGEPLYPFGYGLSYTTFSYSGLKVRATKDGGESVAIKVKNTGKLAGDEVVQLYVSRADAPTEATLPIRALRGFTRIHLQPGERKTVTLNLTPFQLAFAGKDGVRTVEPGKVMIGVGGSQTAAQSATIKVSQRIVNPPYAHNGPVVE